MSNNLSRNSVGQYTLRRPLNPALNTSCEERPSDPLIVVNSEVHIQHDTVAGLAGFKSGEGLVDLAHREVLGLRRDLVP